MDYKIIKNFISSEEQNDLVKWIMNNKNNPELFKDAGMKGNRIQLYGKQSQKKLLI